MGDILAGLDVGRPKNGMRVFWRGGAGWWHRVACFAFEEAAERPTRAGGYDCALSSREARLNPPRRPLAEASVGCRVQGLGCSG